MAVAGGECRYRLSSVTSIVSRTSLTSLCDIVFKRKFIRKLQTNQLQQLLFVVYRSHHVSIIKLLGASVSGDHIYLVYDFVSDANLSYCLSNKNNTRFIILSTWMSRKQVATNLAHALDYIHNKTGLSISFVHNRIKSSGIIVTDPFFNARVCHFGTAQFCGEIDLKNEQLGEISEIGDKFSSFPMRSRQFEGMRGYMASKFQASNVVTHRSDIYAFKVVVLELLSGEEPLKFKYDENTRKFLRTSVIETMRGVVDDGDGGVQGKLRKWVDQRLKDSFSGDVAEKLTRVTL